jgi:hypothetical protein
MQLEFFHPVLKRFVRGNITHELFVDVKRQSLPCNMCQLLTEQTYYVIAHSHGDFIMERV